MAIELTLKNCIICYPHLWQVHAYRDNEPKYQCELIVPANGPQQATLQQAFLQELSAEGKSEYAANIPPPWKTGEQVNAGRMAKGKAPRQELTGKISLTPKDEKYKPSVKWQDGVTDIREEDSRAIFSGCEVNAKIRLYWLDAYPGVWVGLSGIQLVRNDLPAIVTGREEVQFEPVEGAPAPVQATPTPPANPAADLPEWMK